MFFANWMKVYLTSPDAAGTVETLVVMHGYLLLTNGPDGKLLLTSELDEVKILSTPLARFFGTGDVKLSIGVATPPPPSYNVQKVVFGAEIRDVSGVT